MLKPLVRNGGGQKNLKKVLDKRYLMRYNK